MTAQGIAVSIQLVLLCSPEILLGFISGSLLPFQRGPPLSFLVPLASCLSCFATHKQGEGPHQTNEPEKLHADSLKLNLAGR